MRQENIFLIFRLTVTLILFATQGYFYQRTIRYTRRNWKSPTPVRVVQALFFLFNVPLIALMFSRPSLLHIPSWFVQYGVYPFYIWHGSFLVLFLLLFFLYVLRLPVAGAWWLIKKLKPVQLKLEKAASDGRFERWSHSRRQFLHRGFTILSGVTFAGTAYGAFAKNDYEITHVSIPIKNLPPQFEGFTITLVADIHSSIFMTKEDMQRYVKAINEVGSEIIVIPGDFVNSMVEEVYPFAEAFS